MNFHSDFHIVFVIIVILLRMNSLIFVVHDMISIWRTFVALSDTLIRTLLMPGCQWQCAAKTRAKWNKSKFTSTCRISMDILSDCSRTEILWDCPLARQKFCASREADGLFHAVRYVTLFGWASSRASQWLSVSLCVCDELNYCFSWRPKQLQPITIHEQMQNYVGNL